jgi:hypothetical protein
VKIKGVSGMVVHTYYPNTQRWRKEDQKFEISMGYVVRPCLQKLKQNIKVAENIVSGRIYSFS